MKTSHVRKTPEAHAARGGLNDIPELFGYLIQVASPLFYRLCHPLSWCANLQLVGLVYLQALADIFWTLTDSLYNSTLKIVFIGSSAYTIYLMVNDYKPTHDPNVDTFKVEYLLGGSAVLAILLPYRYTIPEVALLVSK